MSCHVMFKTRSGQCLEKLYLLDKKSVSEGEPLRWLAYSCNHMIIIISSTWTAVHMWLCIFFNCAAVLSRLWLKQEWSSLPVVVCWPVQGTHVSTYRVLSWESDLNIKHVFHQIRSSNYQYLNPSESFNSDLPQDNFSANARFVEHGYICTHTMIGLYLVCL